MTFKQSPQGYRNVRGSVVQELQARLNALGYNAGVVDGEWGNSTMTALQNWQQAQGLSPTGVVDDQTWQTLIQQPVPELWKRALQLTADWEGTGYGGSNGNFDGQGITWGIVGFTWKNIELQGILQEIRRQYPQIFTAAFGPLEQEMVTVLGQSIQDQMGWAVRISLPPHGEHISPRWASAFAALGEYLEVREIENMHAHGRYWNAATGHASSWGLQSEPGQALCFDVAVQNNVTPAMNSDIQNQIQNSGASEADRMRIVATVVADHARPQYHDDVLTRKMTFVTGRGAVHGDRYDISCWGVA
jgi:hypothetical protein